MTAPILARHEAAAGATPEQKARACRLRKKLTGHHAKDDTLIAAALAEERVKTCNDIIALMPGGQLVDPQAVCDMIRTLTEPGRG